MTDLLFYLLRTGAAFAVLYLIYRLCFRRLTFHALNRMVLLATLPLSLLIPLVDIELASARTPVPGNLPLFFGEAGVWVQESLEPGQGSEAARSWTWLPVSLYFTGLLLFLLRTLMGARRLLRISRSAGSRVDGPYRISRADVPGAFSVFHWICLPLKGGSEPGSHSEAAILAHEKLHAGAGHSLDLLAAELYALMFWFNPFVWFFRRDLRSVHEFQVDARLLQGGYSHRADYLQLLLDSLVPGHRHAGLMNQFNGITIKKRVTMMTKQASSRWKLARYFLLLPVIALMSLSFHSAPDLHPVPERPQLNSESTAFSNDTPSISPIKAGEDYRVTSTYGMRMHPVLKVEKLHAGMDFAAKEGTPIVATASGVVSKVRFHEEGYGKMVVVDHGGGFQTLYSQMSDYAVKPGQKVSKAEVIGYVGSSGMSTGPHLHYEVRREGEPVDPMDYIK